MAKKNIDRQALMQAIRESHELTNEQKADILQLISEQKKYGLVWEDSVEEIEETLRTKIPVLVEDKSKAIVTPPLEGKGEVNHILIEGDNLPALDALTYTHEGKVDVIYIDPPYNTGNKDFVYNDSFVDSEDGYRHSKWLSFMEKRLRIAKKLLSDKGVIFISIDDNEQANLKLLCDEVFGADNFLANVIWEKKYTVANDAKYFSDNHDFIVTYAKNKESFVIGQLPRTEEMNAAYKNPDNHPKGPWKATPLHARSGSEASANFSYTFKNGVVFTPPKGRFSAYSEETLRKFDEGDEIWFGTNGKSVPSRKTFLCDLKKDGVVPRTIISFEQGGHNHEADEEIKNIMGSKVFTSPKPTKLIKLLLTIANLSDDSIILDFFAGSGTTLHATMQLNAEDGGHRQCILVTNNENNICEEVTYERNKRVIKGYTTPKGVEVEGLHNNNLRYYKMEFVDRENTSANRLALMKGATDMLCIKEGIYTEIRNLGKLELRKKYVRYFAESKTEDGKAQGKQMLVIYEPMAVKFIAKELRDDKTIATKEHPLHIFVYSDGGYAYQDEFEGLLDVVELTAMPDALMQSLRNILPEQVTGNEALAINEEGGQDND